MDEISLLAYLFFIIFPHVAPLLPQVSYFLKIIFAFVFLSLISVLRDASIHDDLNSCRLSSYAWAGRSGVEEAKGGGNRAIETRCE